MKADARRTRGMRFAVPDEAPKPVAESTLPDTGVREDGAGSSDQERPPEAALDAGALGEASASAEATEEELGLPEIDSLDADSDYTPFMSDKVSDAIRNRALRKLWRSDPVLACVDGLNDYDEDYTDAAMVVSGMKSDYVVGRGMVDFEAEEAKKRAAQEPEEVSAVASADGEEGAEEPDRASEATETDELAPAVAELDDQVKDGPVLSSNKNENINLDDPNSVRSKRDAVSIS